MSFSTTAAARQNDTNVSIAVVAISTFGMRRDAAAGDALVARDNARSDIVLRRRVTDDKRKVGCAANALISIPLRLALASFSMSR